ncbi:hypothetical protein RAH32_00145 [Paracoccus sp. WLY502]|uniref:hypothetical protein n=1 Tax=Paracoccus yibinensis TaxID=3068891 RepID=UPI002796A1AA|nr:hypothetical protein [Paracoccus sp. WLY502]MDQ1898856.1 hypothetical protein [Paracoccus sp. WLY502]
MPTMVRVYIRSVLIGAALACCFVAALLALDVAHLRHLILKSEAGWLALFMLVFFNAIVFAGVQFAIAVMGQAETPPSPGKRAWIARPSLVPVLQKSAIRTNRK